MLLDQIVAIEQFARPPMEEWRPETRAALEWQEATPHEISTARLKLVQS
jgi:hypothetical protein